MYVSPMPDADDLAQMYGEDYGRFLKGDSGHSGHEGIQRVVDYLKTRQPGNFLDYGCGGGLLLRSVKSMGWNCFGVDFDRSKTRDLRENGGINIGGDLQDLDPSIRFDVVHFGDVLEHLTDVNLQFPPIIERVSDGGSVIAQGPLEANANLFLFGLRFIKLMRNTVSAMPPYHVSLATAQGQKRFFRRFGLGEMEFRVFETAHPAPEKLTISEITNLRSTTLWTLRSMSRMLSSIAPGQMGNRYIYIGKRF
jgi:SAM-dependent methyltransferase